MEILLGRHGETDRNIQGLTHFKYDEIGLNDFGKAQAERMSESAVEHAATALFTSPELRARETADIIGTRIGITPQVVGDLLERDWGDWNGRPWSEIEAKLENMSLRERYEFTPPNGESWSGMSTRLRRAIDKIVETTSDNVMIVTHGGALRALVPSLKGENLERSLHYSFDNASITLFTYSTSQGYTLKFENSTSHLR